MAVHLRVERTRSAMLELDHFDAGDVFDVCGLRTSLTLCRREMLSAGERVERCSS